MSQPSQKKQKQLPLASGRSKLTHKKQLLRQWGKQAGAERSALLGKPFGGMTTRIDPAY
jgi:hypothetical protein